MSNTTELLWQAARVGHKRALPILSFPAAQALNVPVDELVRSAELQARTMIHGAELMPQAAAAVSLMDLSVEAEAFGASVRFSPTEVPAVTGQLISSEEEAAALKVPGLDAGRIPVCVEAVRLAKKGISDRPVLAGVIGPFSLAGRLMDVTEIFYACYDEPETVHAVVDKAAQFIQSYIEAFRTAGADGVVMAEPLAGLLNPEMMAEFSCPAVQRIIQAVQTPDFPVVYHNCGNITAAVLPSLVQMGAAAYHFGNAISMEEFVCKMPENVLVMGNIDPAGQFVHGTPETMRQATLDLMRACGTHANFVPSSGCDIPYHADWNNIRAFFAAVEESQR